MLKEDIIKAQKIVSNSSTNIVSDTPFHKDSFIYRATNEDISKYQEYLKNRENTLSIIASGNQILNSIYEGNKNITGFDISTFPKYYLELQIASLNTLKLKDYLNFIYGDISDEEFDDIYSSIHPILEEDSKVFWDSLFNFFDYSEVVNSTLFSKEVVYPKSVAQKNIYLQSEENYQKLKDNIKKANLKYITGNIFNLTKELDEEYDFINLSSIIYYNQLNEYKTMLEALPLMDNGEALTYLYKTNSFLDYFSNCNFHKFKDTDSGVMIYQKKKSKCDMNPVSWTK